MQKKLLNKKYVTNFISPILRSPKGTKFMIISGFLIVFFLLFIAIFSDFIAPYDPYLRSLEKVKPPSSTHIMGTDALGRDVFSRIIYGSRNSLMVAAITVSITTIIGILLGSISGFYGGKIDRVMLLFFDAMYSLPTTIMALLVVTMIGRGILNISFAMVLPMLGPYYRMIRSITLTVKERTFIEAEKALGASNIYIIVKHILPFFISTLSVLISMSIARTILTTAFLGFLGLGIPPPIPEWGTDLNMGRLWIPRGVWWITLFPGLFIFVAVIGFNLLSEGLNEMFRSEKQIYYK